MRNTGRAGLRAYHLLGVIPTLGMLGGLVFANRVRPLVLGLPFLVAWIAAWVLATSLVMWCILRLDRAHERREGGDPNNVAERPS